MPRLRMMYLIPAAGFGGAERQATYHLGLLDRHGVDAVAVVGPGREAPAALRARGVEDFIFRDDLPFDVKAPRSLVARARLYGDYLRSYFSLVDDLAEEARRRRIELVFASRPFAWVVGAQVGARLGIPVVWRAGTLIEHWAQVPALRYLARRYPPAGVVYASEAVRRALDGFIGAPSWVLHNGVDTRRFRPGAGARDWRRRAGIPDEAPVVALVARVAPEKGLGMLLDVCARLRDAVPGVTVVVAGDSGWRGRVEAALARGGLDGTVRLLGHVERVEDVYAAADVVVLTSVSEGCPNAVLEAMAMGVPVVATRVGGTPEIIRDGVDGLLVAPGDAPRLARRVTALLELPAWRNDLGRAALRTIRARFTVEAQVERLAELLRHAAGRARFRAGGREAA